MDTFLTQVFCTFSTTLQLQSVYFATYAYNNEASIGARFDLLNTILPPPFILKGDEENLCVAGKSYFLYIIINAKCCKRCRMFINEQNNLEPAIAMTLSRYHSKTFQTFPTYKSASDWFKIYFDWRILDRWKPFRQIRWNDNCNTQEPVGLRIVSCRTISR